MKQNLLLLVSILVATTFTSFAQTNTDPVVTVNIPLTAVKFEQPETSICCKPYTALVKTALPLEAIEHKLDEKSPTYDFGTGTQTYLLLELPAYTKPYHINIADMPQAPGIFNRENFSQIPLIIETLDSNYISMRMYKHGSMKKRGMGYDKTIFINPSNSSEKYILIYGDTKASNETSTISEKNFDIGSTVAVNLLVIIASGGRYIPNGAMMQGGDDRKISIVASDKGVLSIQVKGLSEAK